MNLKDWMMIFVPATISIIGFLWTYYGIKRQVKNSMEQSIFEQKKNLYIETVVLMEKLTDDFREINKKSVQEKLRRVIAELDLFGNSDIVKVFRRFGTSIFDHYDEYVSSVNGEKGSNDIEKSFEELQEKYLKEMQESIDLIIEMMREDMNIK